MGSSNPAPERVPSGLGRLPLLALLGALIGGPAVAPVCAATAASAPFPPYEHSLVGNPADVRRARGPRLPAAVLMGGGPDVDAAFRWLIARSGGGDLVVIRSRGTDAYNAYIFAMGGLDSVETLVIPSREAANDPFVIDRINKAEALFIANGYQSDYLRYWKGTGVDRAIRRLIARKVPIGGSSAGLAVLGQFDFGALNGTVYSDFALADPYNSRMTLDRGFIQAPYLDRVITDTHLDFRDRMGRLVSFMARIVQDGWAARVRGIGVEVGTALLVEGGTATRVGSGSVYFLQNRGAPQVCKKGVPLTFRDIEVQRLSGSGTFDLRQWRGRGAATTRYRLEVENGKLGSTQRDGKIY